MNSTRLDTGSVNYAAPAGGVDKSDGAGKLKGAKVKKFSFSKLFGHKKGGISEPKLLNNRENKVMSDGIGNLMNKYKDYITPGSGKFNQEVFDFTCGLGGKSAVLDKNHAKELFDKIDTQIQEIIFLSSVSGQSLKNLLKSLGQEFGLDLSPLLKGGNCTGISESANNMLKPFVNVFINRAKQNPAYSFDKNSNEAKSLKGMLESYQRSAATPQPGPTPTPAKPESEVAGTHVPSTETAPAAQPEIGPASVQPKEPKVEATADTAVQPAAGGEYNIDDAVNRLESELKSNKVDVGDLRNVISDLRNQKDDNKLKNLRNLMQDFDNTLNNEGFSQKRKELLLPRKAGDINLFMRKFRNESAQKANSNSEVSVVTAQPEPTPAPAKPESEVADTHVPSTETAPAAQPPEVKQASTQPGESQPKATDVSSAASEQKKEGVSDLRDKKPEAPESLSFKDRLKVYDDWGNASATGQKGASASSVRKINPELLKRFGGINPMGTQKK